MDKRLFFIITFVFIFVLMLLSVFFQKNDVPDINSVKKTSLSTVVESPPRTVDFPSTPIGASFIFLGKKPNFPLKIPVYRLSDTESPQQLTRSGDLFSEKFSVLATPSAIIREGAFAYTRVDNNRWFSLARTDGITSITYERLLVEDDTVLVSQGKGEINTFFSKLLNLSIGLTFYDLATDTTPQEGVIMRERPLPKTRSYKFGIALNTFPILTREYSERWASAVVDEKGAIRVLNFLIPPTVTPYTNVQAISIDDAINNINGGRGEIVRVSQPGKSFYDVSRASFKRGTLTECKLVYIYQDRLLVPAYVFSGTGVSSDGQEQRFDMLVLAYSKNP